MNGAGPITILLTAAALAMDACAVSLSSGLLLRQVPVRRALRVPAAFGLFQAGMPLAGAWAGVELRTAIAAWDHWVAFGLLAAVGGKMIWDSLQKETGPRTDPTHTGTLLVLALATSIDALVVGAGFSMAGLPVGALAVAAGVVTFALSALAVYIGNRFLGIMETAAGLAGGVILMGIGLQILVKHMGAAA